MNAAEIAAELERENRGATLLLAESQYSEHGPDRPRISIVRVERDCLKNAWDGHVAKSEWDALVSALGAFATVWKCESDAMARTAWGKLWTLPPAPFRMFAGTGLRVAVDGDLVRLRRFPCRTLQLTRGEIERVEVTLSPDWTRRAVALVKRGGARVHVAGELDLFPLADPTYDRINLLFEAAWARSLAGSLAAALGVKATIPEEI